MEWHFPNDLRYTEKHEWVKMWEQDGQKEILIGITEYAQDQLSEIVFIELPEVGRDLKKGDTLAVIESVKAVSDVYSPVEGSVSEVNETLIDTPELLNKDPYGTGWIARISIAAETEFMALMSVTEYHKFVEQAEEAV